LGRFSRWQEFYTAYRRGKMTEEAKEKGDEIVRAFHYVEQDA